MRRRSRPGAPTNWCVRTPPRRALLSYAEHTQGRALPHVQSLQVQRDDELIDLPIATRRNLELVQTLRGEDFAHPLLGAGHLHRPAWAAASQKLAAGGRGASAASASGAWMPSSRCGAAPGSGCAPSSRAPAIVERITARIALRQVRPRELVGLRLSLEKAAQLSRTLEGGAELLERLRADLAPPPGCATAGRAPCWRSRLRWCATAA